MFTSTVVLAGTIVIDGVAFRWSVTDGVAQQISVSHPSLGTRTQPLTASPDSQARSVGRSMLNGEIAAVGFLEAFDEAAPCDDDPSEESFVPVD